MSQNYWSSSQEAINHDKAEALEFGVGTGIIGAQRHWVTDEIWHLIEGSYAFGINPLPMLRKALPNFKWRFHDLSEKRNVEKALRARVVESDFFWFTTVFYDRLITARRINSSEKPFIIIGHTFQSMRDSCANSPNDTIKLLKCWGVREDREEYSSV